MIVREFDYYAPETLAEATALLTEHGAAARIIAGGTDLIIFMNDKVMAPQVVIDVSRIPDLTGLCFDPETGLRIGAATKYRTIELSAEVKQHYPYLQQGAEEVGSVQIRNLGTPGGNVATASPAGDFLTPLLAGAATARLASSRGERTVPLDEFFLGPRQTVLAADEIIVDLHLPAPPPRTSGLYIKHCERRQMDLAFVGVAVSVTLAAGNGVVQDARIALGAVAPTPLRATAAEAAVRGQSLDAATLVAAGRLAAEVTNPISDVRSSAEYRRTMTDVLTQRALRQAAAQAAAA
ncbi:MAG: xanthine dehydrogenase family protein subunit M [Chloroflexota bacterium]|nr:xanthine dehydrogenase family protein subunit M [Chloroflexota bacterium]